MIALILYFNVWIALALAAFFYAVTYPLETAELIRELLKFIQDLTHWKR